MKSPNTATATTTWVRHDCLTGWYMTANFWIFHRSYFVCSECGKSWKKNDHDWYLSTFRKSKEASDER